MYLLGYPNSLIPFHSMRALLWRFNVVGNFETYVALHVKCPTFLSYFNQFCNFSTDFHNIRNIRSHLYQLDAQNFYFTMSLFHASTCFEHNVLIIRRSKFYSLLYHHTYRWPSRAQVERGFSQLVHRTATYKV